MADAHELVIHGCKIKVAQKSFTIDGKRIWIDPNNPNMIEQLTDALNHLGQRAITNLVVEMDKDYYPI